MPSTTVRLTIAVRKTNRHPYQVVRLLGPRAKPGPGEVAIPIRLEVDDAHFNRATNVVVLDVAGPPKVTGTADQPLGAPFP